MRKICIAVSLGLLILVSCRPGGDEDLQILREGFTDPPLEARPRALWDWVDGNFQMEEISREMEEARRMGLGGFDIWDVRSVVDEDSIMPAGPPFMSDEYLEAICHAINEAERLDMDLGLVIASGWNAGGSWTRPEHQTMGLFTSEIELKGPVDIMKKLDFPILPEVAGKAGREKKPFIPRGEDGMPVFYEDVAVIAYQEDSGLVQGEVLELNEFVNDQGVLNWEVPEGKWKVVRYVCTNSGIPMISSTPNSGGPMIDHFSAEAGEAHIRYFIERIEEKLGKPIGESGLDYFYTDSYEMYGQLWTPELSDEFEIRCGYSLLPFLPVLSGAEVVSAEITRRFLYDYRRVLSDLIIENHFGRIREVCEEHGVEFVAEAAGPGAPVHDCPFESIKSSGSLSFPRGEFWHIPDNSDFWRRTMTPEKREHYLNEIQVIKGVASASHLYGQKYVEAEAFTGTHLWNEGPGDLKPTADRAFCEGLNRVIFHTWPHTPEEAGTPGWAYAFGTLINDHRIWWPMAGPFMDYLGRCSFLLQEGNFVGDVLFYYGDSVPNFAPPKSLIPGLGSGYDYDYCNSDIILNHLEVEGDRLITPGGQSYEVLVLPEIEYMQPEILEKITALVEAGAIVVGPEPLRSHGFHNYQARDRKVREMAEELWGACDGKKITRNAYGAGEVRWGEELRNVLLDKGVLPDFGFRGEGAGNPLDYIHRKDGESDIYYIRNTTAEHVSGIALFRQEGKGAEYWDPATGEIFPAGVEEDVPGLSRLTLELDSHGSIFVVFSPLMKKVPTNSGNIPSSFLTGDLKLAMELEGPWNVYFPEASAGAGKVVFDSLLSWILRPEDGIRFFSGIASYEKEFRWESSAGKEDERYFIEIEKVVETARIYLNDKETGIVWKAPFRLEVTGVLKPGINHLRIEVANTWQNGLAGDVRLPEEQRRTRTNVRRLPNAWAVPMEAIPNDEYELIESGLMGQVSILQYPVS